MKIYIFICVTSKDREYQASCIEPMNRYNYLRDDEEMKDCKLKSIIERKLL